MLSLFCQAATAATAVLCLNHSAQNTVGHTAQKAADGDDEQPLKTENRKPPEQPAGQAENQSDEQRAGKGGGHPQRTHSA